MSRLHQFEAERGRLEQGLSEAEEALHRERSKVGQLEGELVSVDMVKEGLSRQVEKVSAHSLTTFAWTAVTT